MHNGCEADVGEEVRFLREWGPAAGQVADSTAEEVSDLAENQPIHQETRKARVQTTTLVVVGEVEYLETQRRPNTIWWSTKRQSIICTI